MCLAIENQLMSSGGSKFRKNLRYQAMRIQTSKKALKPLENLPLSSLAPQRSGSKFLETLSTAVIFNQDQLEAHYQGSIHQDSKLNGRFVLQFQRHSTPGSLIYSSGRLQHGRSTPAIWATLGSVLDQLCNREPRTLAAHLPGHHRKASGMSNVRDHPISISGKWTSGCGTQRHVHRRGPATPIKCHSSSCADAMRSPNTPLKGFNIVDAMLDLLPYAACIRVRNIRCLFYGTFYLLFSVQTHAKDRLLTQLSIVVLRDVLALDANVQGVCCIGCNGGRRTVEICT
ncbi:hypothetical protein B0H19DRAFT_1062841 [Mycena capillaripes]|nr:hypothetical protein B0H19DRAFT_1062841 [Mycena capillaripes]